MRVRQAGKICEKLWALGREESFIYVVVGRDHSMIVNGGISAIVLDVLEQLETFGIDEERITKILILHAHFDHVGVVPFFRRRRPDMEIFASERAWDLLGTSRVRKTINELSRAVAKRVGAKEVYEKYDLEWKDDISGAAVYEGDRISLGDIQVQIHETPGHSSCSISAYLPELKALFASDAGGIPYRDTIIASGNSNYTDFQQSLEKLKDLDVEYACADHYGYLTGTEARNFIHDTIREAEERRKSIEKIYRRTRDVDATVQEMVEAFYKENPDYLLTPEISRGVYRQIVRHIASSM
ncbi:MAG: MBL fold metallo-hydrolase [Pseudomonadota bacterium]